LQGAAYNISGGPIMAAVLAAVKRGAPTEVAKLLQEGVDPNIPVRTRRSDTRLLSGLVFFVAQ